MINAKRVQEFIDLARDRIGDERLRGITGAAAAKGAFIRKTLGQQVRAEDMAAALSAVFAARRPLRRRGPETGANAPSVLAPAAAALLYGGGPVTPRLDEFCAVAHGVFGPAAADVGTDLLHSTFPDRYWLWTRWIWNPVDGTGLVTLVGSGLPPSAEDSPGENYMKVGEELAHLRVVLEASGGAFGPMPFALDSYMAVVVALYAYMVASVRTTEEFAGILPRPAELAARLLGARRWLPAGVDDRNVPLTGEGGMR